jgi:glycosyltransferase involved in cell wall biosynthesis
MMPELEGASVAEAVKNRIRVMFVLPSLARAGAETQTVSLINGLDPRLFDKYLYVFEEQLDLLDRLDRSNVAFTQVQRRYKMDFAPARELARIIEREKIDIVHCSLQIALLFGWLAVRMSGRKPRLALALHTTKDSFSRKDLWFDRYVYRWMMRGCDAVVCVCKTQRDAWVERLPFLKSRVHVVYNGIDTEQFRLQEGDCSRVALRTSLGISSDAFVVASIAAFRPEKDHGTLLAAFQALRDIVPEARLLLAGDGPLRSMTEDRARMLGLAPFVHFLGAQADIRPVLAAADVSVIASTAETFSMAMLESLAMEVPMVATDVGGTREAVRPGVSGILVEVADPVAMANALAELANDPDKRRLMGRRGRQIVESEFTVAQMRLETAAVLGRVSQVGSA